MTVVRKVDGGWVVLDGIVTLVEMATTATMHFRGSRPDEIVSVEPYPVETAPMDAGKIAQFFAEGVWGDDEKARYGLALAVPFLVPDGKRPAGDMTIVEVEGVPHEHYAVEDVPPPAPPPKPEEKVAAAGLTEAEFDELVAKSLARQGGQA
jgi:hypothetical protein